MPRWIGWLACLVAVVNVIGVPAVYLGNNFLQAAVAGGNASVGLYSYANSAAGLAYLVWLFATAGSMLAGQRKAAAPMLSNRSQTNEELDT